MKIALIGAGVIGRLRAAAVKASHVCELVAVADIDTASADKLANSYGAQSFADYRSMFDVPGLEAVIVSSPAPLHKEMCLAALERGCHVLCEKPLAPNLESCRQIRRAAELQRRVVAVGFNHRFYPAIKYLKSCIEAGHIGSLDHLRVFGGHDGIHNFRAEWMYKGELSGGGAMMDVGLHMTDLARYVAGEIAEVYGYCSQQIWKVDGSEDNALAVFKTVDGIPILYQATWTEWRGYQFFVEAYGDRGMIRGSYAPMQNLLVVQENSRGRFRRRVRRYPRIMVREKLRGWQSTTLQTLQDELQDFVRMIRGEENLRLANAWDGERAVEVASALYEANDTGSPVKLTEPPHDDC